jgi:acetylornithine/succinyldiaminopimelate/putrescine aminotransferase
MTEPLELAEPNLREWMSTIGLDAEYVRAAGNTLYRLDENGAEVPVLDIVGGYGALILGHHHPRVVATARRVLDAQAPVHAQFSYNPYATRIAAMLNGIIRRELATDEPYFAVFANSGAEAIEAAVKHAELDRVLKLAALTEKITANVARVTAEVDQGRATLPAGGLAVPLAEIAARNAEQAARPPVLIALEGGFHGKLIGSVQLTHNVGFRTPFSGLATSARFVPVNQPGALAKVLESERATLVDVAVQDGQVRLVECDFPLVCAFVVEPILGEAGIVMLTADFAAEVERACMAADCPIIVDEIQSGMGRTGAFFAASRIGLRGDYLVLAKSLAGGLTKAAVMLARQSRYRPEFEFLHSSTFAKDGFSCQVGLTVLEVLEEDNGRAYQMAAERGERLIRRLHRVAVDFPEVIKDVRGTGLMIGLEFYDQSRSGAAAIRSAAESQMLGYALAGYLLREHGIRIFPTASATNTLRFEPSIYLSEAEINQVDGALRRLCALLREQDDHFLAPT